MKKLGLLIFAIAVIGSFAAVWAITGNAIQAPSFGFFKKIKGSGNIVTERRDVSGFTGVDASGAMQIEIVAGKEFAVELTGDDNILPLIETEVRGNTLYFERKRSRIEPSGALKARIALPELTDLDISGASSASAVDVVTESLDLRASGASKIEISGNARALNAKLSGASKLNAEKLTSENVQVKANGASRAAVFASEAVDADANGASKITYAGNPKSVNKDASGASTIAAN